jgi:hypothetical protein
MDDDHDSWFGSVGVDIGALRDAAAAAANSVAQTVQDAGQTVSNTVSNAEQDASNAAAQAQAAAAQAAQDAQAAADQAAKEAQAAADRVAKAAQAAAQSAQTAASDALQTVQQAANDAVAGAQQAANQAVTTVQQLAGDALQTAEAAAAGAQQTVANVVDTAQADIVGAAATVQQAASDAVATAQAAAADVVQAVQSLPAGAALADLTGGGLNSPSYVSGQAPDTLSGGPNASAGDSVFVTGYKGSLLDRVSKIKDIATGFYKTAGDIESKSSHWYNPFSKDSDMIASAKSINDFAKTLMVLAGEIDNWTGGPNKEAITKGSDAEKYVGNLLTAADFVVSCRNASLAVDQMDKEDSEAAVNAWADSVCDVFDKAGGMIGLIPSGALPGFMTDYYKGLFSAPKNYVTAFRKIMKEHYDYINKEGRMPSDAKVQAYDLGMAETVWEGALTGLYIGAQWQPKAKDGTTLQQFMTSHKDSGPVSLYKAKLEAGKALLVGMIDAEIPFDDPAHDAWVAYLS